MNKEFHRHLGAESEAKGGWTRTLVWPESVAVFGNTGPVKVRGTIDGSPVTEARSGPWGDGNP